MHQKVFSASDFIKISNSMYTGIDTNITLALEKYNKENLLENAIILNHIVSDISNSSLDWGKWRDPDEYYTLPVYSHDFFNLFFEKFQNVNSKRVKRVYDGILLIDYSLRLVIEGFE